MADSNRGEAHLISQEVDSDASTVEVSYPIDLEEPAVDERPALTVFFKLSGLDLWMEEPFGQGVYSTSGDPSLVTTLGSVRQVMNYHLLSTVRDAAIMDNVVFMNGERDIPVEDEFATHILFAQTQTSPDGTETNPYIVKFRQKFYMHIKLQLPSHEAYPVVVVEFVDFHHWTMLDFRQLVNSTLNETRYNVSDYLFWNGSAMKREDEGDNLLCNNVEGSTFWTRIIGNTASTAFTVRLKILTREDPVSWVDPGAIDA